MTPRASQSAVLFLALLAWTQFADLRSVALVPTEGLCQTAAECSAGPEDDSEPIALLQSYLHRHREDKTQACDVKPGTIITLTGGRSGKFCSDRGAQIVCDAAAVTATERFEVVDVGNGQIGLRGGFLQKMCSDTGTAMECNREWSRLWEFYTVKAYAGDRITLQGARDGSFCTDDPGGVRCNQKVEGTNEKFGVACVGKVEEATYALTYFLNAGDSVLVTSTCEASTSGFTVSFCTIKECVLIPLLFGISFPQKMMSTNSLGNDTVADVPLILPAPSIAPNVTKALFTWTPEKWEITVNEERKYGLDLVHRMRDQATVIKVRSSGFCPTRFEIVPKLVPCRLVPGDIVTLTGGRSNKLCSDYGNRVVCDKDVVSVSEKFEVVSAGDGIIGLRGGFRGAMCADIASALECNRLWAQLWEQYTVTAFPGNYVALRGLRDNSYCTDDPNGVRCTQKEAGINERFRATCVGKTAQSGYNLLYYLNSGDSLLVSTRCSSDTPDYTISFCANEVCASEPLRLGVSYASQEVVRTSFGITSGCGEVAARGPSLQAGQLTQVLFTWSPQKWDISLDDVRQPYLDFPHCSELAIKYVKVTTYGQCVSTYDIIKAGR